MRFAVSLLVASALLNVALLLALRAAIGRLRDGVGAVTLPGSIRWWFEGGSAHLVLVVEPSCLACHDRLDELTNELAADPTLSDRMTIVSSQASADVQRFGSKTGVAVRFDPRLPAELGCSALPEFILITADGQVSWRRIAGSPDVLVAALEQLRSSLQEVRT